MQMRNRALFHERSIPDIVRYLRSHRTPVAAGFISIVLISLWGLSMISMEDSFDSWFTPDDPIVLATERYTSVFGNHESVSILVTSDDIFSAASLTQLQKLEHDLTEHVPYVRSVSSIVSLSLPEPMLRGFKFFPLIQTETLDNPDEIKALIQHLESHDYLRGRLYTDDHKQTWLTIEFATFPSIDSLGQKIDPVMLVGGAVQAVLKEYQGPHFSTIATGIPIVTFEQQTYFLNEASRIITLALLVALAVSYLLIRSLKEVIYILLTATVSIVITYGLFGLAGLSIDTTLMTLPLCLGLATSIGYNIHLHNSIQLMIPQYPDADARIYQALKHTNKPLFFTALTSILALLSFNLIHIIPVRWVGNASALIIAVVFLVTIIVMPVLRSYASVTAYRKSTTLTQKISVLMTHLSTRVFLNKGLITVISIGLLILGLIGFARIDIDMNSTRVIGTRIPYMQRFQELSKSEIATLYTYDIMLELEDDVSSNPDIIASSFQELESYAKSLSLTKNTNSFLDYFRISNWLRHHKNPVHFTIPTQPSEQLALINMMMLSDQPLIRKWVNFDRGVLRLQIGVDEYDPDRVVKEIEQLKQRAGELFPDARISLVGTFVQFSMIQLYIAHGQILSLLFAIITIGLMLIIVFRSFKTGLIAMVPNIAPVICIGGVMGWFKLPLDSITMTVMPLILGIAVDDSIHFVDHTRRLVKEGIGYDEALGRTYREIGPALLKTTLILVLMFSVYFLSLANFFNVLALLVLVGLIAALLADLTLTPLLIRFYKPFKPK